MYVRYTYRYICLYLSLQNLTPLIFSFELPIMSASQTVPDSTSPYVVKIQEKYNVQVMFRTRPKLHATLVVVKGCEWEVSQVKEATVLLIHYMCQNLAVSTIILSFCFSPLHDPIYSNLIPHPSRVKYKYKCRWRFRRNITASYWESRAAI